MKRQRNLWVWVIPVLLLAAGLVAHRLNAYPFDIDELASMRLAGDNHFGPYSLTEVWQSIADNSPDQAYGLPFMNWFWGRVFGWSEFGMRLLPFFAGLLALAWAYRTGHDFFAPQAGLYAVLLLATSVFFVTYMHVVRAFTLAVLFAVMTIWSYRFIALQPATHKRQRLAQASFLIGSIGIVYAHYFSAFVLVVLFFWHLLFMSKDRRWWRLLMLFGVAGAAFLPELTTFYHGAAWTQSKPWFTQGMLRTFEVLPRFLYVLTNGILRLPWLRTPLWINIGLLVLFTLTLSYAWWRMKYHRNSSQLAFLSFATLAGLILVLLSNEILQVFRESRMRYLIVLWPMFSLLFGWGIWRMHSRRRLLTVSLTSVLVTYGIWANVSSDLRHDLYALLRQNPIHMASDEVQIHSTTYDLLLLDHQMWDAIYFLHPYYFKPFINHYFVLENSGDSKLELSRTAREHLRLWLLAGVAHGVQHRTITANLPPELLFCERFIDQKNLVLELYTWSAAHCPSDEPAQMRFGEEIELAASAVAIVASDTLQVDLLMYSEESIAMTAYSVALHVFDVESGAKVAQGDQGLWLGRYNPVRSEIDISALGAGEYEVRVGVYNWQTLERLEGVDLTNDTAANLLTLSRFQVE